MKYRHQIFSEMLMVSAKFVGDKYDQLQLAVSFFSFVSIFFEHRIAHGHRTSTEPLAVWPLRS
jgi:hypothetical protein